MVLQTCKLELFFVAIMVAELPDDSVASAAGGREVRRLKMRWYFSALL